MSLATRRSRWAGGGLAICLGLILIAVSRCATADPDALWQIISQQCLPNQRSHHQPAPCQQVDEQAGFVTLKDLHGPLQYLLMPVARITGMESPALLANTTPHFFALAWQQRNLMAKKRGQPIADQAISLAINSAYGRSQNQLHVHISCLRPAIRRELDELAPELSEAWQAHSLLGHRYWLRTLTSGELAQQSVFRRVADELEASKHMGEYSLALASLTPDQLVLLATRVNRLKGNFASAEELQDHQCQLLHH